MDTSQKGNQPEPLFWGSLTGFMLLNLAISGAAFYYLLRPEVGRAFDPPVSAGI